MWESDPFEPKIRDGLIFGRGAADMKSSCAIKLHVISILKKLEDKLQGMVRVEMVSDEERGGRYGTAYLVDCIQVGKLSKPDWVIIGEKSDFKIRCAERGTFMYKITIKGRSTHTFNARVDGVNAIYLAARVISQLEKPYGQAHPLVGYPIISVNQIHGGKAFNQVPAVCEFIVDRRTVPGETLEALKEEAIQILENLKKTYDFTYNLEVLSHSNASMTDQSEPIVKVFQTISQDLLGIQPEFFVDWAGGTDAKHYRKIGVPTIIYGPLGDHRHGPNEYVRIDSLETVAKVYLGVALALLT
jgi:acetylornithine deacetylase/succinyl-diaminopimelate desuccinylase-like protein